VALTVAIIGAGPLGRWLAQEAARAGFRVLLEDVMPHNLQHAHEALRQALGPEALSTVVFSSTIEEAVRSADLVIDCVPDELESKLEILWLLDRMAPSRTVFATPTTRLSISDLAACTYRPDKVVGLAVEASSLIAGAGQEISIRTTARTTPETVALVDAFWRSLKFSPSFRLEGG
jgi:3-hydroxybutyryl-CoA dehydrogenase